MSPADKDRIAQINHDLRQAAERFRAAGFAAENAARALRAFGAAGLTMEQVKTSLTLPEDPYRPK